MKGIKTVCDFCEFPCSNDWCEYYKRRKRLALDAPLQTEPKNELKPFKDLKFMEWFIDSKAPIYHIHKYYLGWTAALDSEQKMRYNEKDDKDR